MTVLRTAVSQETDVRGSEHQTSSLNVADEQRRLGVPVGPSGSTASIVSMMGNLLTVVGLSGLSSTSEGHDLSLSGCNSLPNNGTFSIIEYLSSSSVIVVNGSGVAPDANNGNIIWEERYLYSLEADLNYTRTDRKEIKGVDYYQTVAPYQQPNAVGTDVATNLTNLSGKTTDAVAYPTDREIFGEAVMAGQSSIIVSLAGQLKHIDPIDTLGIPCFDTAPFVGEFNTCFVKLLDGYTTGVEMAVIAGPHAGERIFGVTANGSSISPDSVEIDFYSCPPWADITVASSPYTWEVGQPNAINIIYGYNERVDTFDFNALRSVPTYLPNNAASGTFLTPFQHQTLRQLIHFIDEGPADGFITGAYKVTLPTGSIFPTSIIWYEDNTKTKIIVSKAIVWAGIVPATITWQVYNTDGITVAHTVSDSITYVNNIFESTRTRTIS
jgi:hypothetical protein